MRGFVNVAKTKGYETIDKYQFESPETFIIRSTMHKETMEFKPCVRAHINHLFAVSGFLFVTRDNP